MPSQPCWSWGVSDEATWDSAPEGFGEAGSCNRCTETPRGAAWRWESRWVCSWGGTGAGGWALAGVGDSAFTGVARQPGLSAESSLHEEVGTGAKGAGGRSTGLWGSRQGTGH